MSAPDKDGWIEWSGGNCPVPSGTGVTMRLRDQPEGEVWTDNPEEMRWSYLNKPGDIVAYKPDQATDSLHAQPEADGFTHESPIRAFTDWTVTGRYAIGKGFRPSLQHLTVYLDAMERLEGWAMLQVLEAASGSPSFVFRKVEQFASLVEMIEAVEICLAAERARRHTLKPGAPATTYCQKRIDRLEAILAGVGR